MSLWDGSINVWDVRLKCCIIVGRGNQYMKLVKVLYCKLLSISKQPLSHIRSLEVSVLPLHHCGSLNNKCYHYLVVVFVCGFKDFIVRVRFTNWTKLTACEMYDPYLITLWFLIFLFHYLQGWEFSWSLQGQWEYCYLTEVPVLYLSATMTDNMRAEITVLPPDSQSFY